jgi:hypothetical protein
MKQFFIIAISSFFILGTGMQSCNKHTCPTYASSAPSKGVKKAVKKSRAAYDKGNAKKDKKSSKGKAKSGL